MRLPGPLLAVAAGAAALVGPREARAAAPPDYDLAVLSVSVDARVRPGGALPARITVRNTGAATWHTGAVQLAFTGSGSWTDAALVLAQRVRPRETVTFTGSLGASTQIGRYSACARRGPT